MTQDPMTLETIHASAAQIGGCGILILGASGAGKSALALDLIDQCHLRGVQASLIGDDRILLTRRGGQTFASPAPQLAGLIEVRGSGIHAIDHVGEAPLHLAVRLVDMADAVRMPPQEAVEVLPGVFLPLLALPQGQSAVRAVLARLGRYGGVKNLVE
jgi:serine kinase of HPr protein (carbohydrate metabolism regulator)